MYTFQEEMKLHEIEEEMEALEKAMENEYEANKESPLYLELYTKYSELEKKYYDAYNHRRKRCIYCGGFEFGEGACPSRQYGATGPCPAKPAKN